jgi:polysaccharide pyruvyl transferase WcaK-like protein
MKRLVISNDGLGSANKGDQAILNAMLADFAISIPHVAVAAFPYSRLRNPRKFISFLIQLGKADLFILGGGHPLQDQTSRAFLFFGLLLILVARIMGKKVLCYAVGAGPIDSRTGKVLAGWILDKANLVSVRDPVSRDILLGLGVKGEKIVLTADAAFTLESVAADQVKNILQAEGIQRRGNPLIALCLRRWFCFQPAFWPHSSRRGKPAGNESEKAKAVKEILKNFCDHLIKKYDASIVFVPMRKSASGRDFGQDDDRYSLEVMAQIENKRRVTLLQGDYSPGELKGILAAMDLVVSVRLHPLILAASSGVPIMGIPFTPSKGEGFFAHMGLHADYIYIDEMDLNSLMAMFERIWSRRKQTGIDLKSRSASLGEKARENIRLVRMLLEADG